MPKIETYRDFLGFVGILFARYQIEIIKDSSRSAADQGYDLKVRSTEGAIAVVEIKLYQSLKVAPDILIRTFDQISVAMSRENLNRGIVVTNARVPSALYRDRTQLTIWDYDTVSFLVKLHPDLASRWARLSQEGFIYRSEALPEPIRPEDIGFLEGFVPLQQEHRPPAKSVQRGTDLCKQLKSIKPGRGKTALDFEIACTDAFKYLFDTDLINWTPQQKSYTKLHRYDLIARVASENDFWNSLISDHRARYIIFEFKNYKEQITQVEIYSTEKYLFPQAMRSTAIIVSRKGVNKNAEWVIHGAFREAGKLIVSLDLDQMCEMLRKRDAGDDPSETLSSVIEDMLVGLER